MSSEDRQFTITFKILWLCLDKAKAIRACCNIVISYLKSCYFGAVLPVDLYDQIPLQPLVRGQCSIILTRDSHLYSYEDFSA